MKAQAENRKGAKLRISEIYASVQGEGLLTGTPSVFVRTSGCNLRCWFCDTPFASSRPEGIQWTIETIASQALQHAPTHIVLTGGEPMIYASLPDLCWALKEPGLHLTIETAGTVLREVDCDLMSISPKLSGSGPRQVSGSWIRAHHQRRQRLDVVRQLIDSYDYQLKFVVDHRQDAEEVLAYLEQLGKFEVDRVLLMPQGIDQQALSHQAEWLIPWCQIHRFRFCPRAHIEWFGNHRGT